MGSGAEQSHSPLGSVSYTGFSALAIVTVETIRFTESPYGGIILYKLADMHTTSWSPMASAGQHLTPILDKMRRDIQDLHV
jgi:hypothetical protein